METHDQDTSNLRLKKLKAMETQLVTIWKRILKKDSIDSHDSFLHLGGNSIEAIQIVTAIETAFSVSLPVITLFQHDTISKLTAYLNKQKKKQPLKQTQTLRKSPQNGDHPITPMQKGLYFISQAEGKCNVAYNIACVLDIEGPLDSNALSSSLDVLIQRHEVLQVTFCERAQGLVQTQLKPDYPVVKVLPETVFPNQLKERTLRLIHTPIQLDQFPLLKAQLFKIKDHEHRLVIVQPHMITDGWSLKVLTEELFTIYTSLIAKRHPCLPPIPIPYFDYIMQEATDSPSKTNDFHFWQSQLKGFQSLTLPYDSPRSQEPDHSGKRHSFSINKTLFEQLNQSCAQQNITPFMWVAATLNLLLSRYCDQKDIMIGFPYSRREYPGLASTIGPLLNTLVLRTSLSCGQRFSQLLQQVKAHCIQAYAHGAVPFNELVKHLNRPRIAGRHPLFDVMLVWQDWYASSLQPTSDITVKPQIIDTQTAKFDLTFEFIPTPSGLQGAIEYRSHLFQPDTIARLADQLIDLLAQSVASPEQPLAGFSLACSPQTAAYLPRHFQTIKAVPNATPHQRFEVQVSKNPHHIALIDEKTYLSYADLNRRANQLAHYIQVRYLAQLAPKKKPFIGIFLNKSTEVIISILAILKTGSAYVPIDTRSPAQRIEFIASDANLSLIITQSDSMDRLKGSNQPSLCLDKAIPAIAESPENNLSIAIQPDDPIYLIYTSGTTGQPKGVVQTHRNVARLFQVTERLFHFSAQDTGLFFHSHAFDFSVWEIWAALCYGGRLVIPDESALVDPKRLVELIKQHQVTVFNQTPSAFRGFMPSFLAQSMDLRSLRCIIFGGEAFHINLLSQWWETFGDTHPQMVNMYGITETTVHTTYRLLSKADLNRRESSNIGVPLDDIQVLIIDPSGEVVPVGIPGELLVGGAGLALGYLNQPALTCEKFIERISPLTGRSVRFYRTGDCVRYLSDGTLEYLGRIDHQMKFKGFRIERAEIEIALEQHPEITQAAVALKPYHDTQRLVAYYTARKAEKEGPSVESLRHFLSTQLPSYMLPNLFIKLASMPLTVNMKTDYAALPSVEEQTITIQPKKQVVMTTAQTRMVAIWEDNLNVTPIGLDDNFFSLGGDSITALQVIAQAQAQGFSLGVSDIYRYQTVQEMVHHGWKNDADQPVFTSSVGAVFSGLNAQDKQQLPQDAVDAYPMAALQSGMIYHTQCSPQEAVYLDVFSYWIEDVYDHSHFLQALKQVIAAQPVLRTTFHLESYSEPLQIVHQWIEPIVIIDTITQQTQQQAQALKDWMEAQKKQPFNFETGPLFRITIHSLSPQTFHLGLAFHHAILDGWSVATFVTTLLALYADLRQGQSKAVSGCPPYRAFIEQEQQALLSEPQKQFWQQQLAGFEGTNLWKWPSQPSDQDSPDFLTQKVTFDPTLTRQLMVLAKTLKVSMDSVLLTGFMKLLSVLTNAQDVLAGVVFNGRPPMPSIEKTLGLFLNTLPFSHSLQPGSWETLILAIFRQKSELYPYRCYPLMQIQKDLGVKQLFHVLFYFTHFHVYSNQASEGTCPPKILRQDFYERTNFPLTFNFTLDARGNQLTLFIHHETQSYPAAQVQMFSNYLRAILNHMVADHQADHEGCEVMSAQEKHHLLVTWNQTDVVYDFSQPIHRLIEQQAKKTPQHIAVQSDHQTLTYEALTIEANNLACVLQEKGASPGDRIVVYMPRSIEAIIAVLAVFKMGGIYVPVDIAQPLERLNHILEEVNCAWIVSHSSVSDTLRNTSKQHNIVHIDQYRKVQSGDQNTHCVSYHTQPEATTYILYTSGSTGKPKGVMITQAALLNVLFFMKDYLGLHPKDRWLALTSFSFDISLLELLLPLLTGSTCILATEEEVKDPFKTIQAIKQQAITCLQATPTMWKMLFDAGYQPDASIKVLSGGEALIQEVGKCLTKADLAWNVYGPTETTIWSTYSSLEGQNVLSSPVSIGKPIANTKAYVLDHDLKPVPIGVPGELFIAGMGVAQGYFNQASLTQARFVDNPFNLKHKTYGILYKTGDRACWLPDGKLYFMGRTDNQFKLRGFRLEAGEVESALLQHQAIKNCVALVRTINGVDCLVIYMTLYQQADRPNSKTLRAFLSKKLPPYMLPEKFITLDVIPTTINGKTDVKALCALPIESAAAHEKIDQQVFTEQQQAIADIWCQVLHVHSVGLDDNFFDVGGNSILSLVTVQRINQHFSTDLSIRALIEYPTVSALSDMITEHQKEPDSLNKPIHDFTLTLKKTITNPIVTLRKQGNLTPLFLIHPVGGTVFYYIPLVNRLQSDRPVYAIQDPGIEAKDRLFSSLTEMIDFYIRTIKKYQPHGPYYIAGSSFGANAAVEMARQLHAQNEQIAFTGLMDGWAKYPDRANNDKQWFANNLISQMKAMKHLLPETKLMDLLIDLHWDRQQLLAQHCLPKELALNLTLFKAKETLPILKPMESPYNHWEHYCLVPPKTYEVPGDHFSMHFKPHIDQLARIFNECLNNKE